MYLIMFVAHVIACSFHYLAQLEIQYLGSNDTWLDKLGNINDVWYIRYFDCKLKFLILSVVLGCYNYDNSRIW
jgi:hypothetical protein